MIEPTDVFATESGGGMLSRDQIAIGQNLKHLYHREVGPMPDRLQALLAELQQREAESS